MTAGINPSIPQTAKVINKRAASTDKPALLLSRNAIAQVRNKFQSNALLAKWWQHFLQLTREDSQRFRAYSALAAVVTETTHDRALARQAMLSLVDSADEAACSCEAQLHSHVLAAPLARWALYYDWLVDYGLFTRTEQKAIESTMIDLAWVYVEQRLTARSLLFDNQLLADAMGAAAVGWIMGVRRGSSPIARHMFKHGMHWLRSIIGILPPGGYGLEGSTYQQTVVLPMATLAGAMIETIDGSPVFYRGLPPNHRPLMALLHSAHQLVGPSGCWPGWDEYGICRADLKANLALLSRLTGDRTPLQTIVQHNLWHSNAMPAWEVDDRLWTLLWWPDESDLHFESTPKRTWMIPQVAAALQSEKNKLRLFQCWDETGGMGCAGRGHCDPNSVTLEAFDSPILLDGAGKPPCVDPSQFSKIAAYAGSERLEAVRQYFSSQWDQTVSDADAINISTAGSVGWSNSIIVDDEPWYLPLNPCHGEGLSIHEAGPIQLVSSDATRFYTDRYDVRQVRRTSMLLHGRYALVTDRIAFDSPHRITWQAYARQNLRVHGSRITINTPEQVQCDVICGQNASWHTTDIADYPRSPEAGSTLIQLRYESACQHRADVLLAPQQCVDQPADLTEGWLRHVGSDRRAVSLHDAWLNDPGRSDLARIFERKLVLDNTSSERIFLRIQSATPSLEVFVNNSLIQSTIKPMRGVWEDSLAVLPLFYDITDAIRPGENQLTLRSPWMHGETLAGPVTLLRRIETAPVTLDVTSPSTASVSIGEQTDELLLPHDEQIVQWLGGQTDAHAGIRTHDGTIVVVNATQLELPNQTCIRLNRPCDFEWSDNRLQIIHANQPVEVTITRQGKSESHTFHSTRQQHDHPYSDERAFPEAPACNAIPRKLTNVEHIRKINDQNQLVRCLDDTDWRIRLAAVQRIGELKLSAAADRLLKLFEQEETARQHPPSTKRWRWSQMLRPSDAPVGDDLSIDRERGTYRWRLKRAVIDALGQIGDERAVAIFEEAMARADDEFPVTASLAQALGKFGRPRSAVALQKHVHHPEINTRLAVRAALRQLETSGQ